MKAVINGTLYRMTDLQKCIDLGEAIEGGLQSLATRRVTLHRWLPFLGSFGDYTPLRQEWEYRTPQRIGSAVRELLLAEGELLIRATDGFEIPRRVEHISRTLELSTVKAIGERGIKVAEVTGVQEIDRIGRDTSRVLPLLLLNDLGDRPQVESVEATSIITVPDLAHYLQTEQVMVAISPLPSSRS